MDKQKRHYKIKVMSLIFAILFSIGYGVLYYFNQKEVNELAEYNERYSGTVEGKYVSYCEGEGATAKCDTDIEYEVDGKTYTLKLGNDAIATKSNTRKVRYNPKNPADAISGGTDYVVKYDAQEEFLKKQKKALPRFILAMAILCFINAFLGYYIDIMRDSMKRASQKVIDTEADLADKKKNS